MATFWDAVISVETLMNEWMNLLQQCIMSETIHRNEIPQMRWWVGQTSQTRENVFISSMRSWQHTFLSHLQHEFFQHQPHKQDFGYYLSTSLTYHITFLSTQCMLSPHAGLHHPLVDKLCKYHLLCLYIVRRWCRQNTKRIQLLMTRCSGETALYTIKR